MTTLHTDDTCDFEGAPFLTRIYLSSPRKNVPVRAFTRGCHGARLAPCFLPCVLPLYVTLCLLVLQPPARVAELTPGSFWDVPVLHEPFLNS